MHHTTPKNLMSCYGELPEELRSLDQWVVWRAENVANKRGEIRTTKVPYNARTDRHAKSNDPRTWSGFDVACNAATTRDYSGIGFCLTEPYVGVDMDGCRPDGRDEPWAAEIITEVNSY